MEECGIDLDREMCVVRLMLRCSLCDEDYVSKEGLWNHLDLHEIVDESKELYYQEVEAKHKLHQCVLCNDQRAYSEYSYWKHVHDVHDGFFLRCSDCGENFRSEQLKADHASSHCKTRHEPFASDSNVLKKEPFPVEVENIISDADDLKLICGEQSSNKNEDHNDGLSEHSSGYLNNIINSESDLPTTNATKSKDVPTRFACDICGMTYSSETLLLRHKRETYSCIGKSPPKCPHCREAFHIKGYHAHGIFCEKKVHHREGILENEEQDQNQRMNSAARPATSFGSGTLISSLNSSSNVPVVDDPDIRLIVENPSSDTKCCHCDKECASAINLRRHIAQFHQPSKCNICEVTFQGCVKLRYHKVTKHTEAKFQCPHCSKKFHYRNNFEDHASSCARLKHVCELCGKKLRSTLEKHMKRFHHGSRHLRNANIEGADGTEEQKQNSAEKMDASHEMASCIVCRITFASTDELTKHELSCSKHAKQQDDSQFGTEKISLLHGVNEAQLNSTIVRQGESMDFKLDIELEETMLQEQVHQVSNEDPGRSFATTLAIPTTNSYVSRNPLPTTSTKLQKPVAKRKVANKSQRVEQKLFKLLSQLDNT